MTFSNSYYSLIVRGRLWALAIIIEISLIYAKIYDNYHHMLNIKFYYIIHEILPQWYGKIVKYFKQYPSNARTVWGFQMIATSILNNAFLAAGVKLKAIEECLAEKILTIKQDVELLNYHRNCNLMKLIKSQYQMLRAVTWRYTHPIQHCKFNRLCFYAGSLLDIMYKLLNMLKYHPCKSNTLRRTMSIIDFGTICKQFMNHFEKFSERKVNKSALVSGCKAIDILDCLIEGREVQSFRICANRGKRGGMVCMKIKYVVKRAWFTHLEVANIAGENYWTDEQRFTYLRLRRFVDSVNIHLYENEHYNREVEFHTPQIPWPKPPPASTYSGYGAYGGHFFYYGNMNKFVYDNKFKVATPNESSDSGSEEENSAEGAINCVNLVILAELRCSPELAPLAIKPLLYSDEFDRIIPNAGRKSEVYLKLNITCPASQNNRLPGNFTWELRTPRKGQR